MAWLPAVLTLAGTVVQANGATAVAGAQSRAANYNAQIAQQNSVIAGQQGVAAVEALRRDQARALGRMKALYGASGVDPETGSPMEVLADSARSAELDVLTTQYNYDLKAAGYQDQANLDRMNAVNARAAGAINATSAVLRGASSYFNTSGAVPKFGS